MIKLSSLDRFNIDSHKHKGIAHLINMAEQPDAILKKGDEIELDGNVVKVKDIERSLGWKVDTRYWILV